MGTVPDEPELPYCSDLDRDGELVRAAGPVLDRVESALAGTRTALVLTDAQAVIMERRTGETSLLNLLDQVRLAPGFCFSEHAAGTNGMGTALHEQRSVSIVGDDHFCSWLRPFTCMGAPIRHPVTGCIEGVLDLTTPNDAAHPLMSGLVEEAVRAIEQRLLDQCVRREQALLQGFMRSRHPARPPALNLTGNKVTGLDFLASTMPADGRSVLDEAAADLIAQGAPAEQEMPLPQGRSGILRCHHLSAATGDGAVVELFLPPHVASAALHRSSSLPAPNSAPLLVGDIGVSRLAVAAQRRLELLCDAGMRIGTTLDVVHSVQELAEVSVPRFADSVVVDLFDTVLSGGVPGPVTLQRAAQSSCRATAAWPVTHNGRPVIHHPDTPEAAAMDGTPIHQGGHLALPLRVGRSVLGVAAFWREEPYTADDF